jgi:phospholipase/carboxylesterase
MKELTTFFDAGSGHEVLGQQHGNYLEFLIREPKLPSSKRRAIVLLHGVGSNEQDLFRYADLLPGDMYVISPRAPLDFGHGKFGWYHVDFSSGKPVINSQEEIAARSVILNLIDQLYEHFELDELFLGGFSQGAIMSYTVGLLNPGRITGIIALSGRLLDEVKPLISNNPSLKSLNVFIGHGILDNMLPVSYSREAGKYISSLGINILSKEYPSGHTISKELFTDLSDWLNAVK